MTLPDGTIVEIPMPSPADTGQVSGHGYRVRGTEGVAEFSTLSEVVNHILDPVNPRLEGHLEAFVVARPAGDGVPPLSAETSGRRSPHKEGQRPSSQFGDPHEH